MKISKKIFTNEHLELFSSIQIRIPNKTIRILQITLQFWSLSSKFEEGDSNPHSRKFRLTKAIRIPHKACHNCFPLDLDDHKNKWSRHRSFLYGCDRSPGVHVLKLGTEIPN